MVVWMRVLVLVLVMNIEQATVLGLELPELLVDGVVLLLGLGEDGLGLLDAHEGRAADGWATGGSAANNLLLAVGRAVVAPVGAIYVVSYAAVAVAVGGPGPVLVAGAAAEHLAVGGSLVRGVDPGRQLLQVDVLGEVRVGAHRLVAREVQGREDVLVDAADRLLAVHLAHRVAGVVVGARGEERGGAVRNGAVLHEAEAARGRVARRGEGRGTRAVRP